MGYKDFSDVPIFGTCRFLGCATSWDALVFGNVGREAQEGPNHIVVFFGNSLDSQELEFLVLWCFVGIAWIPRVWNSWSCGVFWELLEFLSWNFWSCGGFGGNGLNSQDLEFLELQQMRNRSFGSSWMWEGKDGLGIQGGIGGVPGWGLGIAFGIFGNLEFLEFPSAAILGDQLFQALAPPGNFQDGKQPGNVRGQDGDPKGTSGIPGIPRRSWSWGDPRKLWNFIPWVPDSGSRSKNLGRAGICLEGREGAGRDLRGTGAGISGNGSREMGEGDGNMGMGKGDGKHGWNFVEPGKGDGITGDGSRGLGVWEAGAGWDGGRGAGRWKRDGSGGTGTEGWEQGMEMGWEQGWEQDRSRGMRAGNGSGGMKNRNRGMGTGMEMRQEQGWKWDGNMGTGAGNGNEETGAGIAEGLENGMEQGWK